MRKPAIAFLLFVAVQVFAAKQSCDDNLPHAINVAIPRTALSTKAAEAATASIRSALSGAYADPCNNGKSLQVNFAFGSDYEVLDWIERGSVDAAIVPNLSLRLLTAGQATPLLSLDGDAGSAIDLAAPLSPAPVCSRYAGGRWQACARSAAEEFDALLADLRDGKPARTRVMFASHLSSTGFLAPIERAAERFGGDEALWERLFERAGFAIVPASTDEALAFALAEEREPSDLTVIVYPGEEVLQGRPVGGGTTYSEHLVLTANGASLFPRARLVSDTATAGLVRTPLAEILATAHPPRPLEVIAQVEPTFGSRTYAFSVNESLRLLRQQQSSSGERELALVLPGGGVKAAYQSEIIDHLYKHDYLRNSALPEKKGSAALPVTSVLGTSGGALLGYFVAQLGQNGPFNLTQILWQRENGSLLDWNDVFGWTDMPRYFSIAWTFLVFCLLLALITGTHRSRFYVRSPAPIGAWRLRLLTVLAVFIAVPILIRLATGGDDVEHVPVVEGLFYSILTVLVMFADQCLIYTWEDTDMRPLRLQWLGLGVLGAVFVFASFFGRTAELLKHPVPFWFAFLTLAVIFLGAPMLLLHAGGRVTRPWRRIADMGTALLAAVVLCAVGLPGRFEIPHIFGLLFLIVLAVVAYLYSNRANISGPVPWVLMLATLLSTAVLCWSEEAKIGPWWRPSATYFTANAFEETGLAPFLASTGCVLLVLSAMIWVYRSRNYTVREGKEFSIGLGLLVMHSIATMGLVWAATLFVPGAIHNLEMTLSFWVALTIFGGLLAVLVLLVATRWEIVRRAIEFLRSEHPNGALLPRRYARMLAVASMSVVWWNLIVAPALYGNGVALRYLRATVRRFDAAFVAGHKGAAQASAARGFQPTTRFVAPTNSLDQHTATRYFLFVPQEKPPADIPRRVAGAEWKVYGTSATKGDCTTVIDPTCARFVEDVVFSSGSPFPIFAAHRVPVPDEGSLRLIDGGYSNDIPIDAARTIRAKQALVVHSSSPFTEDEHAHRGERPPVSFGMLVRNATRLPGFMFERGQQADRLSRQNLFVVALAPKVEPGEAWPGLAQFDSATVSQLRRTAQRNLYERIGFVESWGEPRFRISEQLPAPAPPPTSGARG